MCGLCSDDLGERENEKRRNQYLAADLRRMADKIEQLADGKIKPHSEDAKNMSYIAHGLIRELVAEWM